MTSAFQALHAEEYTFQTYISALSLPEFLNFTQQQRFSTSQKYAHLASCPRAVYCETKAEYFTMFNCWKPESQAFCAAFQTIGNQLGVDGNVSDYLALINSTIGLSAIQTPLQTIFSAILNSHILTQPLNLYATPQVSYTQTAILTSVSALCIKHDPQNESLYFGPVIALGCYEASFAGMASLFQNSADPECTKYSPAGIVLWANAIRAVELTYLINPAISALYC